MYESLSTEQHWKLSEDLANARQVHESNRRGGFRDQPLEGALNYIDKVTTPKIVSLRQQAESGRLRESAQRAQIKSLQDNLALSQEANDRLASLLESQAKELVAQAKDLVAQQASIHGLEAANAKLGSGFRANEYAAGLAERRLARIEDLSRELALSQEINDKLTKWRSEAFKMPEPAEYAALISSRDAARHELKARELDVALLKQEVAKLRKSRAEVTDDLALLSQQKDEIQDQLISAQNQLRTSSQAGETVLNGVQSLKDQLQSAQEQITVLRDQLQSAQMTNTSLDYRLSRLGNSTDRELKSVQDQLDVAHGIAATRQLAIDDLREQIKIVMRERDVARGMSSEKLGVINRLGKRIDFFESLFDGIYSTIGQAKSVRTSGAARPNISDLGSITPRPGADNVYDTKGNRIDLSEESWSRLRQESQENASIPDLEQE